MAEEKSTSIFQGVIDAINKNRKTTPQMDALPSFSTNQTTVSKKTGTVNSNTIQDIQQGFLDWQINKINNDLYNRKLYYDSDRLTAYQDFRSMDMSPEVSAALTIMRDECLVRSEDGDILGIYSENVRVKNVLKDLFHNRLNIEFNLRLWIRDLMKYGDYFVHLHVDGDEGIYDFQALPTEEVFREEGYNNNPNATRFRWEATNQYFEEWQIAHFRLLEDTKRIPYGRSVLDSARKIWKQLQLAEDSMLVYRFSRAAERKVFYIEVGNLSDDDVKQYIQQVQMALKKQPVVDSRNGNFNVKYDPMNITEDYFIPIRGEKSSKIDTLPGATNMNDIADIQYLENKLFAALQVPKDYLNYGESLPGGSTLSQKDLRFSRTINSIQQAILAELKRIANIHLYFCGFGDYIDEFELTLTNPSTQQELLKLEIMKARLEVFKEMFSGAATDPVSYTYAMQKILGLSNEEIKLILKQKKIEKKIFAEIDAAATTYKKIGLFKDLDNKFEIPGSDQNPPPAGEGEGGEEAAGFQGSSALGGGGDLDATGIDDLGAEPGGEIPTGTEAGGETAGGETAGGETEAPTPEAVTENLKRIVKNKDKNIDSMLEELLGKEIKSKSHEEIISSNPFIKKQDSLNFKTKKMIENLENKFKENKEIESKIEEYDISDNVINLESSLLRTSDFLNKKADELKNNIDFIINESEE